ncbi:hypothetical protein C5167_002306 [Papaver somniferum]|uniref:Uncharacterized protein n=1 Tax=Papaver somniferum TaxID=3469 RepID=A0A4Y7KSI3_PAPSO|nr:hypothetical protein C5167_002306 [Papaver somniferum]
MKREPLPKRAKGVPKIRGTGSIRENSGIHIKLANAREYFIYLAKESDMVEWVDNRTQVAIAVKKLRQPSVYLLQKGAMYTKGFSRIGTIRQGTSFLQFELTELGHTDRDQFVLSAPHPTPATVFPHVVATWWLEQVRSIVLTC